MCFESSALCSDDTTGGEKILKKKLSDAISVIQEQDKLIHQGNKLSLHPINIIISHYLFSFVHKKFTILSHFIHLFQTQYSLFTSALFGRISGLYSASEMNLLDGPDFRDPEYPISPPCLDDNKDENESVMSYADFDSDFLPPGMKIKICSLS